MEFQKTRSESYGERVLNIFMLVEGCCFIQKCPSVFMEARNDSEDKFLEQLKKRTEFCRHVPLQMRVSNTIMKGTKVQTLGAVACARVHGYGLSFAYQLHLAIA